MTESIVLRIILTGILAIVPSKKDPNLTRVIVPNHMEISAGHAGIPPHFAFLDLRAADVVSADPNLQYLKYRAGDLTEHVVYLLRPGSTLSLANAPTNRELKPNPKHPKDKKNPSAGEERSPDYALQVEKLCVSCKTIDPAYFATNAALVAARMDLVGGRESVTPPNLSEVWDLEGQADQPLAQEVVYDFDVPGANETIVVTGEDGVARRIEVKPSKGTQVDVKLGNGPLVSILGLDSNFSGTHHDDHFALLYDMFDPQPETKPVLMLVKAADSHVENVIGPRDNCIPPKLLAQDPPQ